MLTDNFLLTEKPFISANNFLLSRDHAISTDNLPVDTLTGKDLSSSVKLYHRSRKSPVTTWSRTNVLGLVKVLHLTMKNTVKQGDRIQNPIVTLET